MLDFLWLNCLDILLYVKIGTACGMPWWLIIHQEHEMAQRPGPRLRHSRSWYGSEHDHVFPCVLLAAVSEDLDPVVFPVLFLVKRSWLCSGFWLPTSPRLLPPLCPCLEHWKVSWGTCSVRAVWEVRKENVAAFRTRLDFSTCPIILMRCFKNCLFFHLG